MEMSKLQEMNGGDLNGSHDQTTPLVNPTEDSGKSPRTKEASKFRQKWRLVLEVVVLVLVLFLLWIVFAAVPSVFYVLKPVLQVTMTIAIYMSIGTAHVSICCNIIVTQ